MALGGYDQMKWNGSAGDESCIGVGVYNSVEERLGKQNQMLRTLWMAERKNT